MGDIYIKPSHRGRLTELKERTGKSEAELYNDGNPAHRKMVVFARNARKWNHALGGRLFAEGGSTADTLLYNYLRENENPIANTLLVRPSSSAVMPTQSVAVQPESDAGISSSYENAVEPVSIDPLNLPARANYGAGYVPNEYPSVPPRGFMRSTDYRASEDLGTGPSRELLENIMRYESLSERPYLDTNGKYAIGYGDQDEATVNYYLAHPDEKISQEDAYKLLNRTVNGIYDFVAKNTENWDKLTRAQKDSLVSYAYNVGIGSYKNKHKALHRALRDLDYEKIADNINAGINNKKLPGLRKRRLEEQQAFRHPETRYFGEKFSVGGIMNRLGKTYGDDRKAMLEAVRKVRANKFEQGGFEDIAPKDGSSIVQDIESNVGDYTDALRDLSLSIADKIKGNIESIPNAVEHTVERTADAVRSVPKVVFDIPRTVKTVAKTVSDIPETAVRAARSVVSEPMQRKVKNMARDFVDSARSRVGSVVDNVQQAAGNAAGTVLSAGADAVFSGMPDLTPKDWIGTNVGDYVYNTGEEAQPDSLDFTQYAAPALDEDENKTPSGNPLFVNPKEYQHWRDTECASFLTNWMLDRGNGSFVSKNNYRGNAWTWLMNAQKAKAAGADNIDIPVNIYAQGWTGREGQNEVIRRTRQITSTPEYKQSLYSNIRPGSVVTLLYPRSHKFDDAAEAFRKGEGNTMSTHVGDIIEKNGTLYVRDNVSGRLHYRKLDDVINGKQGDGVLITGVVNYDGGGSKPHYSYEGFGYDLDGTKLQKYDNIAGPAAYRMMSAIDRNKNVLRDKYGIDDEDMAKYTQMAMSLGLQESYMANSGMYQATAGNQEPSKFVEDAFKPGADTKRELGYAWEAAKAKVKPVGEVIGEAWNSIFGGKDTAPMFAESKGLTNIKYRGDRGDGKPLFTWEELEGLGITKEKFHDKRFMESPEVSALLTMVTLKKKNDEITEILDPLPYDIRGDQELKDALLRQSWNDGTKTIRKTVQNILSGKSDKNALLQFKDATLRPRLENGNLDTSWYTDTIKERMDYLVERTSPLQRALKSGDLSGLSEENVANLQRFLVSKGYLNETINGRNQIDGKVGKNTKGALLKYIQDLNKDKQAKVEYELERDRKREDRKKLEAENRKKDEERARKAAASFSNKNYLTTVPKPQSKKTQSKPQQKKKSSSGTYFNDLYRNQNFSYRSGD